MATIFTEDKETVFAYLTIHDFFDIYILEDALQYLQSMLKAANGRKAWKRSWPFSLLHYMQQLDKLCSAAFIIDDRRAHRGVAILKTATPGASPGIQQLEACSGGRQGDNTWSCFPRSLTAAQFYDPYKAIKKFCNYMAEPAWKEAFAELQEYALGPGTINDLHPPYNILMLQLRLAQLIEACHLLQVRSNQVKNKKK